MLHCQPMRYIVFGAGGIGSAIGGMLAHSGKSVILVARPPHAEIINQSGLTIIAPHRELHISLPAVTTIFKIPPSDNNIILLTVKSQDSSKALEQLKMWARQRLNSSTTGKDTTKVSRLTDVGDPIKTGNKNSIKDENCVGDESRDEDRAAIPIVCLQNGVENEELAAQHFSNVIGGLVHFNTNFLSPARVKRPLWNTIALGCYPQAPPDQLVEAIALDLRQADFEVHTHTNIMRPKWGKLLANLNNATNAITDTHLQKALADPAHRAFMARVMAEGLEIVDRAGIPLDDGGIFDARKMVEALRQPPKQEHNRVLPPGECSYPSTWQDLKLKRGDLEVYHLNGVILRLADKLRVPAPYNRLLMLKINEMVQNGYPPGRYSLADLELALPEEAQQ